jgi:hypothetical protein
VNESSDRGSGTTTDTTETYLRGIDLSKLLPAFSLKRPESEGVSPAGQGRTRGHHDSRHMDSDVVSGVSKLTTPKLQGALKRPPLLHRVHYRLIMKKETQPLDEINDINMNLEVIEHLVEGQAVSVFRMPIFI